jgi:Secretion system C-terminal sorting domain
MLKWIYFVGIMLVFPIFLLAQKQDRYWVLGQNASLKFDFGIVPNPQFEKGNFNVISASNNASICDKNTGELLIYSHGLIIYNKNGIPMENGDSINPGKYSYNSYPSGLLTYDGVSILPFPEHENLFYVIYTNADSIYASNYLASRLYYSVVDMSLNNGLGKVIKKDIVILNEWLENGRINAIQHANGRDWWLIVNGNNDSQHYILLLCPNGIKFIASQIIGLPYYSNSTFNAQTCVNQSGTQIVYSYSTFDEAHQHRLDFYDFDRCSGLLSNYKTIPFNDSLPISGCAFSPNDSLFYVNNIFHLYQYNLKDKNDTQQIPIDTFDINIFDPFHVLFGSEKIAVDNKIYIGAWNGSRQLHCITKPNIRGKGCGFIKGYLRTDTLTQNFNDALPNYPNFRLGALKGSECDTIKETPPETIPLEGELYLYPNPASKTLICQYANVQATTLFIYDMLGRALPPMLLTKTGEHHISIDISNLPIGLYVLKVANAKGLIKTMKFMKE